MAEEDKPEEVSEETGADRTPEAVTDTPAEATPAEGKAADASAASAAPAAPAAPAAAPVEDKKPEKPRTAEDIFLELEGDEDAEKNKVIKAKKSKNILNGVVHVAATFNNTIVTVSDPAGNVIGWSSSGKMGFRGSRKSTAYAAQLVAQDACRQAMSHGLKNAEVRVKGPGAGRESAVRAVQGLGIEVTGITDVTPIPHNGCRPKKARRV
jgi:small subunit ribosomal protein S11